MQKAKYHKELELRSIVTRCLRALIKSIFSQANRRIIVENGPKLSYGMQVGSESCMMIGPLS